MNFERLWLIAKIIIGFCLLSLFVDAYRNPDDFERFEALVYRLLIMFVVVMVIWRFFKKKPGK